MKKTAKTVIEAMFNEYLERYSDAWNELDQAQQDAFNTYHDRMEAGEADPEDLADVQYMALKAGFFAGFRKAEELATEAETE